MKTEYVILIIVLILLAVIGLLVYVLITYSKRRQALITKGLSEGYITPEDACLTGYFSVTAPARTTYSRIADILGAWMVKTGMSKYLIMTLGKEKINIFPESQGALVKRFVKHVQITKDMVTSITKEANRGIYTVITINLHDGMSLKFFLIPYKKFTPDMSSALEIIETYKEE